MTPSPRITLKTPPPLPDLSISHFHHHPVRMGEGCLSSSLPAVTISNLTRCDYASAAGGSSYLTKKELFFPPVNESVNTTYEMNVVYLVFFSFCPPSVFWVVRLSNGHSSPTVCFSLAREGHWSIRISAEGKRRCWLPGPRGDIYIY